MAEITPVMPEQKTYPSSPKFTQKSNNNTPQYPILDKYIVETKDGRLEWSVNSTKSPIAVVNTFLQKIGQNHSTKLSGPRVFELDIESLYNIRLQIGSHPIINTAKIEVLLKTLHPNYNK